MRRESIRSGGNTQEAPSFETRFASKFKSAQFLPAPEPFTDCQKTYPSRNNQQRNNNYYMVVLLIIFFISSLTPRKCNKKSPGSPTSESKSYCWSSTPATSTYARTIIRENVGGKYVEMLNISAFNYRFKIFIFLTSTIMKVKY